MYSCLLEYDSIRLLFLGIFSQMFMYATLLPQFDRQIYSSHALLLGLAFNLRPVS